MALFRFLNLSIFDEFEFRDRSRQLDLLSRGDYSPIKDELRRAFPNSNLPVRAVPFVQKYVAEMAGLYARPVVRTFAASAGGAAKLAEVYDASRIDVAMERAEAALWVQNTVLMVPLPDGPRRLRVLVALPWQVEPTVVDPLRADDPAGWSRVEIQVPSTVREGQVIYGTMVLTPTEAWRVQGVERVGIYRADGTHPFGRIPCVLAHRVAPDPGRWAAPVNESVLNLQVSLSLQEADNEVIVRQCAWPQKVIENADPAQMVEEIVIGPDKIVALIKADANATSGPRMTVVQGQVPVSELASFAEHRVRLYCSMLGLDPSAFLRVNTSVTASARLFAAQDRAMQRDKVKPALLRLEADLVRLVAAVLNLDGALAIQVESVSVSVQWQEPELSADPLHDVQAIRDSIALGLTTAADVVAAREGIGAAAAAVKVAANLATTRALQPAAPPPPDPSPQPPPPEPAEA